MKSFFNDECFVNGSIVEGLTSDLPYFYIIDYFSKSQENVIVLVNSLFEATQLYQSLLTFRDDILFFPMDDFLTSVAVAISPELKMKRLETLEHISDGKHIIVTNLMGYLRFNARVDSFASLTFKLSVKQNISREIIIEKLEQFGYKRDTMVTMTGEYAVRGFVLDIFLPMLEHPIRIEFFGNEIDSIRYFDEDTQRSISSISEVTISPITEIISDGYNSLLDYVPNSTVIIFNNQQLMVGYEKLLLEVSDYNQRENSDKKYFFAWEEVIPKKVLYLNSIESSLSKDVISFNSSKISLFHGDFELLKDSINKFISNGKIVILMLSKESQGKIIGELFANNVHFCHDFNVLSGVVNICYYKINHGFIFNNYVVIGEYDIEDVSVGIKYRNNLRMGRKINSLDALKVGDYVVHLAYGIGIYCGVKALATNGIMKDYLQIMYHGNDKVYVPVEKISNIYKYSDADGKKPDLSSLNSTAWEKKKRSVAKRIHDISSELIKLYASRKQVKGDAYVSYPLEDVFASSFMYEETRDQKRAIADIFADLAKKEPMDRLLCGDVGFGKTEVAFRAMFKTVLNNKQVFYLCPTTILSKQQYEGALERFRDYPLNIALLNRFTSSKDCKKIIAGLASGTIDIVFGTHRLLSDDISFKRLGLLIIDEEQRFGVTHKEKIKKFRNDVNVLTLSATPIPRTLKMALSGLRDLSIIDTPPVNRYPVQTYVIAENDLIIKDAIYKELARSGQVFVLYNRVESIEDVVNRLQKLVPEARICFAHGQMNKASLEKIMEDFVLGSFDVLVSTTIIETGIDIPNANTLIIFDADCFGLSQLYQLRGRVGRSDKIAYAYFMYRKNRILNDDAVKRLNAIRDFTELGSGYKIAMRDLSIRGAGDLLGSEQAGFVDSVGISLYMKMIEDEMNRLKGINEEEVIDNNPLVKVETHISDDYVSDESVKIFVHQKINEIDSELKLKEVSDELVDRFGYVTKEMEIYMYEEWFEKICNSLGVKDVVQTNDYICIRLPSDISEKIKGDKLFLEAYNIHPKFQISYSDKKISIKLFFRVCEKHFLYYYVPLFLKIKSDLEV